MRKLILILAIGIAAGYWWGFSDAQVNKHDVVTRLMARVGGRSRTAVASDPDSALDSLERR